MPYNKTGQGIIETLLLSMVTVCPFSKRENKEWHYLMRAELMQNEGLPNVRTMVSLRFYIAENRLPRKPLEPIWG